MHCQANGPGVPNFLWMPRASLIGNGSDHWTLAAGFFIVTNQTLMESNSQAP